MKKILSIIALFAALFFIGKKIYQYPEKQNIKRINQLYYSQRFTEAKIELEKHLVTYPGSSKAWAYLGLVNIELNDTVGAKKAYNKSYELDNKSDKALGGLGVVERMKGNYAKARQYYEQALAINPVNPDCFSSLSVLEIKNKNYAKAVEWGEKAKRLNLLKNRPGILSNLVIAYHLNHQVKERDEALAELRKMNYPDIKYTEMVVNGEMDIVELL